MGIIIILNVINMSNLIHVLLSGGVGSRLWPVSRKSMPKQYIRMFGDKSLFQLTAERNTGSARHCIVVGNKDNQQLSRRDLMDAGITDYSEIVESAPRNTAAAIAFAALACAPDDIMLVTPSDHVITNKDAYDVAVKEAASFAGEGYLVTFGITPSKAETGYGYIEYRDNDVVSFREKPSLELAEKFISSGDFLWNSGMFCFTAGTYLKELSQHEPGLYQSSVEAFRAISDNIVPQEQTMKIPAISVDYAVMERSQKIKVVKGNFEWSDLGSFESIWAYWASEGEKHRFVQNNCVVSSQKHVEFLGVSGLMLVETDDAILVLAKDHSQDVKKIYERLEREKPELVN